jgi:hypothetical protein
VESAVTLIPDAYTDSDFFDLEQRQVFGRNWVVAGPATQVKNTGDILVTDIGGQSVIITRDEGGGFARFLQCLPASRYTTVRCQWRCQKTYYLPLSRLGIQFAWRLRGHTAF